MAASDDKAKLNEFKIFLNKGRPPAKVDMLELPFDGEMSAEQLGRVLSANSRTGKNDIFEVRHYKPFAGILLS